MHPEEQTELLHLLDRERQTVIYPGITRSSDVGVIKDVSTDGKACEIVYSSCSEREIDQIIEDQKRQARAAPYALEWKVYGHDRPDCLGERLKAAGFQSGAQEVFMVLTATGQALDRFRSSPTNIPHDIRRVTTWAGLADYRLIVEEVRGRKCEAEIAQYASVMEQFPDTMSIYVAYVDGEPATCGRVYFHEESRFAALYGGNTREQFRRRGLFTQMVATRIREALSRGVVSICVDALPTSEPILRRRGFEAITSTQPFHFSPASSSADP